ncbi:MAG: cellulase family glycosylhydrolase [Fimbriimonadaceae bacterium]|nr:cellulase family glycosylhydrolase [Fimbriimonadaceae bacterium]
MLGCWAVLAVSLAATPVVTVQDGQLRRDGRPYRAFGLNVRDLADRVLDEGPAAQASFDCLRWLGQQQVPFIRFWASYFNNRAKYLANPAQYWERMDLLVAAAEQANVGLLPTLFWCNWDVPWDHGESRLDWGRADSQTRAFAARYTREFIERYRDRPIVWIYEYANESNLAWDLPNWQQFLPAERRIDANAATAAVGQAALQWFGSEVRRLDPRRPISSGCSAPRPAQWHMATAAERQHNPWTVDSLDERVIAAGWTAPDPVDLLSVHHYEPHTGYDPAKTRANVAELMTVAQRLRKPLLIGEFGVLDGHGKIGPEFDTAPYQANARDLCEAIYQAQVPLAAWWVYAVEPWGFCMGALNPQYGKFDGIAALLREYNAKIASDLAREG